MSATNDKECCFYCVPENRICMA